MCLNSVQWTRLAAAQEAREVSAAPRVPVPADLDCLEILEQSLGKIVANRRTFLPRWEKQSVVATHVTKAGKARLSDIFKEKTQEELPSGERKLRPALTPEEIRKFRSFWDAMLIGKMDIDQSRRVKAFQGWFEKKYHSKYPLITADLLEGTFQGATMRQVLDYYWEEYFRDPGNDRMLASVLNMTPVELRQAIWKRSRRFMAYVGTVMATGYAFNVFNNLGPNGAGAWSKDVTNSWWSWFFNRWNKRKIERIDEKIAALTKQLASYDFTHLKPEEAKVYWSGRYGFYNRYADLFRELNALKQQPALTLTPAGAGPASGPEAKGVSVRQTAWTNLDLAMKRYQAAVLALANPGASATKVEDPHQLKVELDKSIQEYAQDLAAWEFIVLSQTPPSTASGNKGVENPTSVAEKVNEANTSRTTANDFDQLSQMAYKTRPGETPFEDFTKAFLAAVSKLNPKG